MNNLDVIRPGSCPCGSGIAHPDGASLPSGGSAEVACACGRRLDLSRTGEAWKLEGVLVREGSVPVSGFSRDLRLAPDAERYWFEFLDGLGRRTLVHIVFSPSRQTAEVKQGDAKPMTVSGISRPTQARRHWLAIRSVSAGNGLPWRREAMRTRRTPDSILG